MQARQQRQHGTQRHARRREDSATQAREFPVADDAFQAAVSATDVSSRQSVKASGYFAPRGAFHHFMCRVGSPAGRDFSF